MKIPSIDELESFQKYLDSYIEKNRIIISYYSDNEKMKKEALERINVINLHKQALEKYKKEIKHAY